MLVTLIYDWRYHNSKWLFTKTFYEALYMLVLKWVLTNKLMIIKIWWIHTVFNLGRYFVLFIFFEGFWINRSWYEKDSAYCSFIVPWNWNWCPMTRESWKNVARANECAQNVDKKFTQINSIFNKHWDNSEYAMF